MTAERPVTAAHQDGGAHHDGTHHDGTARTTTTAERTMVIEVNGTATEVDDDVDLGTVIDERVPDRRGVAVALDGEVVPRATWDDTPLQAGARLEIVGAVQGG
jgi:sulfur carrier protein